MLHLAVNSPRSALQLLTRSIEFGHGRLAVVRLWIATEAGADIPEPHWRYCRGVVDACGDRTLTALLARAEAHNPPGRPVPVHSGGLRWN